ncbi:hypothetical protein CCA_00390 [Chlamydia caviae GPIC]|uniref:Uncharacterized protein n=2 Tax=Chlamydia caviae TaxID=83557 RepID=Q823L9_CHLCV|nr:hypothetical protein CCA_00390 [Chlamydia caviae GPIC]
MWLLYAHFFIFLKFLLYILFRVPQSVAPNLLKINNFELNCLCLLLYLRRIEMTSPTGRGNANPGFIFDEDSNIGGNSTDEERRGTPRPGGARRISARVEDVLQQTNVSGVNAASQTDDPPPMQVTAQPGSDDHRRLSARVQSLLGSLRQGGVAPAPTPTSIPAPSAAPTAESSGDAGMESLLSLFSHFGGRGLPPMSTADAMQPIDSVVTTQPAPRRLDMLAAGITPGAFALSAMTLPTPPVTTQPVTTQPVTTQPAPGYVLQQPSSGLAPEARALLSLLTQANGGGIHAPAPAAMPLPVTTQPAAAPVSPAQAAGYLTASNMVNPGTNPALNSLLGLLNQAGGGVAIPNLGGIPSIPWSTQPVSGGASQQTLMGLLGLFGQGTGGLSGLNPQMFLSMLQGIAATPGPYQNGAKAILDLLQGHTGTSIQHGLGAIANLVSGQGSTASNVGAAVQALSGLAGLAGPAGVAVGGVASLLAAAVTSEPVRRGGRFCYDNWHTGCEGNCCCPQCGCEEGECGCGSLGRCLCGLFGNCCGVGVDARRELEQQLREIEAEYGDSIFLIALSNLGIDTVALLSGSTALILPSLDRIREECGHCSRDLPGILKRKTNAMWAAAAQCYDNVLRNPSLRASFVAGMAGRCDINAAQLADDIRILHLWGGDGSLVVASPFDMEKLALTLPELNVTSRRSPVAGPLGAITAAVVMQDLARVLMKASHGRRQIWLSVNDLMTLTCMILAYRGISIVSDDVFTEGSKIHRRADMRRLFTDIDNRRFLNERTRGPAPYETLVNPYVELATRCFAESAARAERMRRPGDASREELLTSLSSRWMLAAGITPANPVVAQPLGLRAPTHMPISDLGEAASRGDQGRDYEREGARPRGDHGNNNAGGSTEEEEETIV